jgi:O-antigen ligase
VTRRLLFLTIVFAVFLFPVTRGAVSVNYSFVLFPVLACLRSGTVRRVPSSQLLAMGIFTMVLVVASVYQVALIDEGMRRLISFTVFMSIFAFTFTKIDSEMIRAFSIAVVVAGVAFSLHSLALLFAGGNLGFEQAKNLIGSQRYGFVYLLAFWLAYLSPQKGRARGIIRLILMLVLAAGLMLTFSRSSVVAFLSTGALYVLVRNWKWLKRPSLMGIVKAIAFVAVVVLLFVLLLRLVPLAFAFFDERLFTFFANGGLGGGLSDQTSSEGARLFLAQQIFEFVNRNPLTGSGYLGVWILPGINIGSAHNQFTDVLFRTGYVGFLAYCFLLIRTLDHFARERQPFFWGFVGILVYGMFHETFKESQGGFILAFSFGMLAESIRSKSALGVLPRSRSSISAERGFVSPVPS